MNWRRIGLIAVVAGSAVFVGRVLLAPPPPATGAAMASVVVPELSAGAQAGESLFNRSCAACHGADAAGQGGVAPPLVHKIYEPSHHGDAAFHLAAGNGVRAHHWGFGNMPPVEGITDPELEKIVLYVRELQRANGIL
ncbi:c-type cytochrome [Hoeflea ulvae]|uniref:Cytochrome c n=1 Tax=Hoeflea ulvae TaxID=2983764 RepID=A0ABT3Y9N0_9HYPH|nr:cytochrome c [Hoeflea ulvae]MCY0092591.1 cytochrome c [Hoeflea ulvae]